MNLEHRIGQLIITSIPGTRMDSETREFIKTIQPGGVLLDGQNIESAQQVLELTTELRAIIKVPPIVAVDQEGGRVDRLKSIFSPMPSADLLRASSDASIAARLGEIMAETLRTLGFNMNFAPVLDISVNDSADNGLKGRYLGSTLAEVVRLAGAFLEGLQHGGVMGVGKHFPGLGPAAVDSHAELPTIDSSRDEILKKDLAPYIELFSKINARLNALIVSHAHYPAFDGPAPLPASISKNIVTGLLREDLSFKGLSITDDMEMGAITRSRELPEAAISSVEAGIDMVLITNSHSPEVVDFRVEGDGRGGRARAHHKNPYQPGIRPYRED